MPVRTGKAAKASRSAQLRLSEKLDQKAAIALAEELRERRGSNLALDASATSHIGTLAIQTIISAARSWARDGHSLKLVNATDTCVEQLGLLGFTPETLVEGTTQ